ncbi:related to arylacetamide deacetylase [Ramularia collo-cygni]|uniref:Related to arylacetamide deacetylase n=1 Tax=Ramularia collo-cygni TaxID=112498 RepID=A0A2D3VB58_9PEZI|nr:related to arylacetamide deacetylase [Ramularia collo-cygni]CZT19914.1 related to arylacetamide deacetylase [Ramularia collo-cygni]
MLLTIEELNKTAQMHPQVAEFYQRYPQPQRKFDVHVYRAFLRSNTEMSLARLGPAPPDMLEFYHNIEMRDGTSSTLKVFKPRCGPPGPLVVLCFGGGFVAGDHDQLTETARISVQLFGATVVNISYRVAPEAKFPTQQLDAWDSVKWIAENATTDVLAADPTKGFILGGVSAGAAITAALSRQFQVDKLAHELTGQWLAVPSVMDINSCPVEYRNFLISHQQNANTPMLSRAVTDVMRDAVETYFQVDGMDLLRDEGLIYDEMLRTAGVQTKLDLYPGCPHAHWPMMRGLEVANKALIDTIVGLGWLLEMDVSRERAADVLGVPLA